MIGRLIISDRNIYKIKSGSKQVSARKCNILSENHSDILIKTAKEFNSRDEYIKLNLQTNTILESFGFVGNESDDLNIYYHLYTNGWLSNSKYLKLWNSYLFDSTSSTTINFDISHSKRIEYLNEVITIDPIGSIDLDDGFSFNYDNIYYYLDIHIADPVSWFDFSNPIMIQIFEELQKRLQSCYIVQTTQINPTHLLPHKIVELISLLEINSDSTIKYRRAISFCFKISKQTKKIDNFELKFTKISNIKNYSYENYDKYINSNIEKKNELVQLSNDLIELIGLKFDSIPIEIDISHKMIEIFMILTNWYGGNYLLNNIKSNPILRTQNANDLNDLNDLDKNINLIPEYARPFLSTSANYTESNKESNIHYSLGISNYAHLSSPMRRFIDMINHMGFHQTNLDKYFNLNNLELINQTIKTQRKIANCHDLVKFIKLNPTSNKFKACLFDWINHNNSNKITGLLVLYQQEYKFIKMVNIEIPLIEKMSEIKKYMEFDIELYYNSNNFKSNKFPFSIKII
jgi:hypothetical protein